MPRSWTGITKTKILTDSDINKAAEEGYLTSKTTIPTTNKGVTKERALQYINIDSQYIPYGSKSPNQLITKGDIRKPCAECTSYNIIINQNDLNDISGNTDNKIYFNYYPCNGTELTSLSFLYSGTYFNYVCVESCANIEPYLYSSFNGGSYLSNSSYVEVAGNCKIQTPDTFSCSGGTFNYSITTPGTTIVNKKIQLDDSYGNFNVTVSATTNNPNTEIFIGNSSEGYGEVFVLTGGTNNITKTIGYYSSNGNNLFDIKVYSDNSGTFVPFDIYITPTCKSVFPCETIDTVTYRKNVVLNVTDGGNITYTNSNGEQRVRYFQVGTTTITECIILETIKSPLILLDPATFTIQYSNTSCTTNTGTTGTYYTTTFSANQGFSATAYWIDIDGITRTRFISVNENFTVCALYGSASGLPFTYGLSCYQSSSCPGCQYYTINTNGNANDGGGGTYIDCYGITQEWGVDNMNPIEIQSLSTPIQTSGTGVNISSCYTNPN
jgi:hypothetical protein